jgi:hypothetical protein
MKDPVPSGQRLYPLPVDGETVQLNMSTIVVMAADVNRATASLGFPRPTPKSAECRAKRAPAAIMVGLGIV